MTSTAGLSKSVSSASTGQPSASELDLKGVAAIEIGYDDKDRVNNLKFIGTDGQSVSPEIYGAKGPDEVKIEYDDKGNISKDIFYRNGEPTAYPFSKDETSDVAAIETKYDEQRRKTELSYLNKTGAPTYRTIYGTLKYYGMNIRIREISAILAISTARALNSKLSRVRFSSVLGNNRDLHRLHLGHQ